MFRLSIIIFVVALLLSASVPVYAFDVEEHNRKIKTESSSSDGLMGSVQRQIDEWTPLVYEIGIDVIIIILISSVVILAFATATKHGQAMRWSGGTMLISFIVIMLLKIGPIFVLTADIISIRLLVTDIVNMLASIGRYAALTMILVGLYFHWFYKIHKHPEFFRWHKNLYIGSAVIFLMSLVFPTIL